MRSLAPTAIVLMILAFYSAQLEATANNIEQQKAVLLRQANELRERNHIRQSIEWCDRILRLDPDCGDALYAKGQAELLLSQSEQAIRDLRRAKELHCGGLKIYQVLAHAYLETERQAQAVDALTAGINSVDRKHCDDELVRERGELYIISGQYKQALQDFSLAMQLNPKQADSWGSRGKAYYAMGQYDKAVEDFSTSLKMRPRDWRMYGLRATAYAKLGKIELARRDREKAKQGDLDF